MSRSTERQSVIVGLFVTVALLILVGAILMIGDINQTFTRTILVHAVFQDVSGLQVGGKVWFSGVTVGTVRDLDLVGSSEVDVTMRIEAGAAEHIHADALAKMGSDGLIGNRIVVLYGGSAEAPLVANGDVLQAGVSVSPEEVLTTLQRNNENLLAITTDLRDITDDLASGRGTVGALISDDTLARRLTDTVGAFADASRDARDVTRSLASFSRKLDSEGSQTIEQLHATTQSASTLVAGLDRATTDSRTPVGALFHDREAGSDLKETIDHFNRSSVLLYENLEAVQHVWPLRGYFKRKAREEAKHPPAAPSEASNQP